MALIAHYKLDETTGTTAVEEIAAVNGAITGGVTLNQVGSPADPAGKSMLFDGVDGVINLGDNLNYDLTDPRSFSFYVNTTNIGASSNMGVMSNTQLSATAQGMAITLFEGKPTFIINTQGDTTRVSVRSDVAIPSGVWSHVVVTKGLTAAASDIKIYIDDVEITSKTIFQDNATGSMSNTNDFTIGNLDSAIYLDALLDDVRIYDSELTAQEVSNIYATQLIAHYKLDETTGTTAVDSVGAVNGAIQSGVTINQAGSPADPSGKSMLFDGGANGYIDLGDNFNFDRTDPFTVSAYVKANTTNQHVIVSSLSSTGIEYALRADGRIQLTMSSDSGQSLVKESGSYTTGVWFHFVATYDGSGNSSGLKIYIDEVEQTYVTDSGSITSGNTFDSTAMRIGGRLNLSLTFDGGIDDVRIYNSELTAQEVSDIYTSPSQVKTSLLIQQYFLAAPVTNSEILTQEYTQLAVVIRDTLLAQQYNLATASTEDTLLSQEYSLLSVEIFNSLLNQSYNLIAPEVKSSILTQQYTLLVLVAEVIQEAITLGETVSINDVLKIVETLNVNDTVTTDIASLIREAINVAQTLSSSAILGELLSSDIQVDDLTKLLFSSLVNESITLSDTVVDSKLFLGLLSEVITLNDSPSTQIQAAQSVIDAMIIADLTIAGFLGTITETMTVSDIVNTVLLKYNKILEDITISIQSTDYLSLLATSSENIVIDNSLSTSAILSNLLRDDMVMITLPAEIAGEGRSGWVMNPLTFGVWNYDNYDFNSLTFWDGQGLMASPEGLFKSGTNLDEQEWITSKIKTSCLDFGTSNLKQIPEIYLGLDITGDCILIVRTEERVEATYKLITPSTHSGLQHINIGKGLISGSFQLELIDSEATEFDLNSIEIHPILFGRKRR